MTSLEVRCPECKAATSIDESQPVGSSVSSQCGRLIPVALCLVVGEKVCPICGEHIKSVASKCRYCGEVFAESFADQQRMQDEVKRQLREKEDKSTAHTLFVSGLIGCLSPILAIYGIVFLIRRPHPFPRKSLAVIGTVLHCFWTIALIAMIVTGAFDNRR